MRQLLPVTVFAWLAAVMLRFDGCFGNGVMDKNSKLIVGGASTYFTLVENLNQPEQSDSHHIHESQSSPVFAPMVSVSSANRQRLLEFLTKPSCRQQNSDDLPTHVMVKLIPIKILDLNEKNEVLETTIRLQISWRDARLAWEPKQYNNISEMVLPGNTIWTPDVGVLNSVSDIYHVVRDSRFEIKVESTGRVWWHPTGIVKTYCKLDLRYFPFDKQMCKIVLESPTLDIRFMNLTLRSVAEPVSTVMYITGETWDLLAVTGYNVIKRLGSKTTFTRVEFVFHIRRARVYHLLNVILPAIFLSIVQVMFFLLPATHPQRVGSSTTTLLSVVVFHSVAASQLPRTSTDLPLLAIYIFIVTFISGLSVCASIFMSKFAVYAEKNHKLPRWLQNLRRPRYCCCCCRRRRRNNRSHGVDNDNNNIDSGLNAVVSIRSDFNQDPETEALKPRETVISNNDHQESEFLFSSWNDVSTTFDFCLLILAGTLAMLSPFILFVVIPWYIDL